MNTEKKILIVSILAIILSLISVAFSIYSYLINNKEIISMSVDLVETNYETLILPINNPLFQSLEQSEDSMNIMIQYYVETINNSINPITINAVYSVPESDFIEESNLLFFNLKRWFKRHESKYSNQISELKKFEPGSSYKFEIVYSHILNKFYYKLLLKDVLPKLSENHGGFHSFYNGYWCDLSTILWIYYINNVDFFGNHIDFQHNGSIPIKFSYDKKSMSDDPFWVVIKTSKNNYFFSRVCFYPKEHKTIPFIALMLEDRDNIKIE